MSKFFIPLDNNINKLIAFTPSLDKEWRQSQRIKSKETQIETLNAVEEFQRQGWLIDGAYEQRGTSRKISNHYVRMKHPDFVMKDKKGNNEALAKKYNAEFAAVPPVVPVKSSSVSIFFHAAPLCMLTL